MLNKGSEICYLFILRYGHLDLLTSMYSYQVPTKENMHKPTWNLVKILITGTIFFYFTLQRFTALLGVFRIVIDTVVNHSIRRKFAPGFVNYKKGCTRLAAASDKVYQLLAHGQWFSPGTPASSTTKTGHHDIAEILLKVALNTKNSNSNFMGIFLLKILWKSAKL